MNIQKQAKSWLLDLQKIQAKALISPKLGEAVSEIQKAIEAKNWELAYQLTAVKSHVCSSLDVEKKYAFREDREANNKTLKASVYSILDCMHYDIAFSSGETPSGRMIVGRRATGQLVMAQMQMKGIHPIVRRMQLESRRTRREVEAHINRRNTSK